jgi:hypothetical protein
MIRINTQGGYWKDGGERGGLLLGEKRKINLEPDVDCVAFSVDFESVYFDRVTWKD